MDEWRTVWHFVFAADPPHPLSAVSGPAVPGAWQTGLDGIGSIAGIPDGVPGSRLTIAQLLGSSRSPA